MPPPARDEEALPRFLHVAQRGRQSRSYTSVCIPANTIAARSFRNRW